MSRITIDPVTRIEGHLRIDAEVDGGVVRKAWSSGQMFRGIERILQGRDPREAWLFTQRFCGVCTTVHAIASVRAVENALQLEVPLNAQYIRNLILAAHAMHDHIVHFYHLSALDWVDVVSALKADPAKTSQLAESLSNWPGNSRMKLAAVRDRLKGFVDNGQLGIFQNGYWGHPAMKLAPEVNLLAVAHYLEALEYQRKVNQVVAILGGKTPNIQNLAVGGVANAINLDNQATLNMQKLYQVKDTLDEIQDFIRQVYFVDVCAIGAMYADWLNYGKGVTNYLSVPDLPLDTKGTEFDFPGGVIMSGDLGHVQEIKTFNEPFFRENVTESIARAWYDGSWSKHPFEEDTEPKYTKFDDNGKYSWVKAPRFKGVPMQVGPLAQVLSGFALGHKPTVHWATKTLETAGSIAKTTLTPAVLHSTLGRHAARMIRTQVIADLAQKHWNLLVNNIAKGDTAIFNEPVFPKGEQRGFGFHEAPRGTLSHWIVIRDGKIANYQAVVPSTWNAGPRDEKDQPGPYEASLVGNPVADAQRPLELIRTVHSFDPCLACAIHTVDIDGHEVAKVRAL
jgi:hydrogenase large subunit